MLCARALAVLEVPGFKAGGGGKEAGSPWYLLRISSAASLHNIVERSRPLPDVSALFPSPPSTRLVAAVTANRQPSAALLTLVSTSDHHPDCALCARRS